MGESEGIEGGRNREGIGEGGVGDKDRGVGRGSQEGRGQDGGVGRV